MKAIWIASVLVLAACVPVEPQEMYIVPRSETRAGVSDLAKFLSVMDEQGDKTDEYMSVLTEFIDCFSDAGWERSELNEQQAMAGLFLITGMSLAFIMTDREEEFESGDIGKRHFYQGLLWIVDYYCYE